MHLFFSRLSLRKRIQLFCAVFVAVTALAGFALTRSSSENVLQLTMLDVGQGDSFLVRAPNGATALIDTGRSGNVVQELGRFMVNDRSIDLVILTHPDADHIGGFPKLLETYDVKRVLATGIQCDTDICAEIDAKILSGDIPLTYARAGERITLDTETGVGIDILHPFREVAGETFSDKNDASIVARLTFGQSEILFTGDAPVSVEQQLIASGLLLESDILKVGHHGSDTSSSEPFLEAVDPEIALVSVGKNSYGHPDGSILERLRAFIGRQYRTDEGGSVSLCSEGNGQWIECPSVFVP